MNAFWSIERVDDTDAPLERQDFIWLGDAERQAQRWLETSPGARIYLFRHRLALHDDEVTVLVEIFSAERQPPLDRTEHQTRRTGATTPPPGDHSE